MMSRLNWMTYLKVLFDKLTQNMSMVLNSGGMQYYDYDLDVDIY
jgi:hypothetical protein